MASDAQQVMLAHSWTKDSGIDPTGYWMAEKLDGVRAYFDGKHFYSRAGNKFFAPPFFSEHLPKDQPLDGELWLGRGRFQQCISIVKNQKTDRADEWKELTYLVFDAPKLNMVYEKRLDYLKSILPTFGKDEIASPASSSTKVPTYSRLVPVQKCLSKSHLMRELDHVQAHGGEGIMLREPRSRYEFKRSRTLLKVKTFFDEEAIVVAQVKGTNKNSHRMGHLEVKTPDGRCFSVGSGFTDAQRNHPPKVGSIITYKFQELSNKLTPRFPTFVGERIDIKWADYCKTYTPPTLKAATPAKVVTLLKQKSLVFQDGDDLDSGSSSKVSDIDESVDVDQENDEAESDTGSSYSPKSISPPSSPSSHSSASNPRKRPLDTENKNDSGTDGDGTDNGNNSDGSNLEPCRYGANCYRKNPDHLKKFSHPPKRARV